MSVSPTDSSSPQPDRRLKWADLLCLILLVSLAVWIRVTHIDSGMSFDELWHLASTLGIGDAMSYYSQDVVHHNAICITSLQNKHSLWGVWTGMDGILHPPLFIVALRLWREAVGESDFAAHSFSIFCGAISVAMTYCTAKLAMNRIAAVLAALTFACAQTQVYFSQEVRGYSMLIAIGSVALWLMTRVQVLGPSRWRLIGLALLTLPLLLTHYFTAGACLAIGIFGLVFGRPHRLAFVGGVLGAALIYGVIWMPFALRQLDDLGTGDAFLKSNDGPLHAVLLAAGAPFRLLVERDYQMELTPLLSVVLFVLPWFLVRRLSALAPWAIWLCASILPILLLDLARGTVHNAYIRYLAVASPAVPLLFLGTLWGQNWRRTAYAFGVLLSFMGTIYLLSDTRVIMDAEDLTPINRAMEPRFEKGDAIISASCGAGPIYQGPIAVTMMHSSKMFPTTLLVASKPLTPELVAELGSKRIWLVGGELPVSIEDFVPGARMEFMQVVTPQLSVRLLRLDSDASTRPN